MKLRYYSLRMKLDDVILNEDFEQKVLENIRYCRNLVGKQFRVIFWNKTLTDKQCEEFVKRNEHLLFEVHTKITKRFNMTWYLIQSDGEKSRWRYKSEGDILDGIASYIKLVKHINKGNK
jgi:hypothetical protein